MKDEALKQALEAIVNEENPKAKEGAYAETAKKLIRKFGWAQKKGQRSKKYLYTLGQLIDYLNNGKNSIWGLDMEIIYLTPRKENTILVKVKEKEEKFRNISLKGEQIRELLLRKIKEGDAQAELLANILSEIY